MDSIQPACLASSSRRLAVNGLTLHALEWARPGAPGLVFVHGGAAHSHWFDCIAESFTDQYHVIALDQRGHGSSAWASPPAYATEDFVADLAGVLDALGWARATFVGHSMGGANCLGLAAWHPDRVERLAILDSRPAVPVERLGVIHERGLRAPRQYSTIESAVASFRLLPRETAADPELLTHLAKAGLVERDGSFMYRFDPASNGQRRPHDMWRHLSKITASTLILRGEFSSVLSPEMAVALCAAIPDARLVEIPGAYHHLTLDRPREVTEALAAFLL